jgi:hypothetical protein
VNLQDRGRSSHVNFTRPEKSLCLQGFADTNDPKYREALAIIQTGRNNLAEYPRPDMPGFRLVDPVEIEQQAKYAARLDSETKMRAAIARGEKEFAADGP